MVCPVRVDKHIDIHGIRIIVLSNLNGLSVPEIPEFSAGARSIVVLGIIIGALDREAAMRAVPGDVLKINPLAKDW